MSISLYSGWRGGKRCACTLPVWITAWSLLLAISGAPAAEGQASSEGNRAGDRIQVSADRLVANLQDNMAEFIGNVFVTQGEATLRADRVKVYTKGTPKGADPARSGIESIERIIASGNVVIDMQEGTAVTDQADYDAGKRILILSGPGTKVTKAGNSLTGSKITLYRDDGRIKVDGSGQQRVRAVFVTEGGMLE
jgi:lipopolysaccharide export system protein LptA